MLITHTELLANGNLLGGVGVDPNPGAKIFIELEIENLFVAGADGVRFVNVRYKHPEEALEETIAAVGIKNGVLMNGPGHLFVLPCPPHCGKNGQTNVDTTFVQAGNMIP